MSLQLTKRDISTLAFFGFLLLYPIFFLYHFAIAIGLVPQLIAAVLKGFYGPVAAVITISYLLSFFAILKVADVQKCWITKIYLIYLVWALILTLANLSFFQQTYTESGAFKLFKDLILQTANFALGSLLVVRNNKKTIWTLFLFWVGIVLLVLLLYHPQWASFYQRLVYDSDIAIRRSEGAEFSSYQGFARSLAITAVLFLALLDKHILRIFVSCITIASLAYIGARSEFVGFLFAIAFFELCLSIHQKNLRISLALLTTLIVGAGLSFWTQIDFSTLAMRGTDVFSLASNDSWLKRMTQITEAWQTLLAQPLTGYFANHLILGDHGEIAHNILSAWIMLGLPGFVLVCILLFGSFSTCVVQAMRASNLSAAWRFSFLLSAMALPQLLITKSAFVEWLPLVFGSVAAASTHSSSLKLRMKQDKSLET